MVPIGGAVQTLTKGGSSGSSVPRRLAACFAEPRESRESSACVESIGEVFSDSSLKLHELACY